MSLDRIIETGSYVGNGATQSVAVGWQPGLVIIASSRPTGPAAGRCLAFKVPSMADDDFLECSGSAQFTTVDGVTLTSTGFDLGSDDVINRNTTIFHWVAIRAGPWIDTGSFVGDGGTVVSTRNRQPSVVLHAQSTAPGIEMFFKFATMPANTAAVFRGSMLSSSGLTLISTGFEASGEANDSGETYDWVAFFDLVGSTRHFETGSYTGDGNASQSISLGKQPKFVMIYNETSQDMCAFKSDTMSDDDYGLLNSNYSFESGVTLVADGFDVGSDFNPSNDVHRFLVGYV